MIMGWIHELGGFEVVAKNKRKQIMVVKVEIDGGENEDLR